MLTDYHPTVLTNLAYNLSLNPWDHSERHDSERPNAQDPVELRVRTLDWQAVDEAVNARSSKDGVENARYRSTAQTLPELRASAAAGAAPTDGNARKKEQTLSDDQLQLDWSRPLEEGASFDMLIAAGKSILIPLRTQPS